MLVKGRWAHMRPARQFVDIDWPGEILAQVADDLGDARYGRAAGGDLVHRRRLVAGHQAVVDLAQDQRGQGRDVARRVEQPHQPVRGVEQAGIGRAQREAAPRRHGFQWRHHRQQVAQQGPVQRDLDAEVGFARRDLGQVGGDRQVDGDHQVLARRRPIAFLAQNDLLAALDHDGQQWIGDGAHRLVRLGLARIGQARHGGFVQSVTAVLGVTGNVGGHGAQPGGHGDRIGHAGNPEETRRAFYRPPAAPARRPDGGSGKTWPALGISGGAFAG